VRAGGFHLPLRARKEWMSLKIRGFAAGWGPGGGLVVLHAGISSLELLLADRTQDSIRSGTCMGGHDAWTWQVECSGGPLHETRTTSLANGSLPTGEAMIATITQNQKMFALKQSRS